MPAAGRDYNIILDVLCFFVFKPICVHLCESVAELLQYYRFSTNPSNYKNSKGLATKSQRHKRTLILKPYQKEKKKVVDTVYTVHQELYYNLGVFVAELLLKKECKERGFSKVSIYNEVKQENGLYTFLFYRVYESYMGMRNNAKKTFNRGFVEVV